MADPEAFYEEVAGLQPVQTLGPGVILVAVLHHEYFPEDLRNAEQILWIRCPGSKPVSVIRSTYRKRFPNLDNVILRYQCQRLSDDILIRELVQPDDNLLALEAIDPSDWEQRSQMTGFSQPPPSYRNPLRDVTNTAPQSHTGKTPGFESKQTQPASIQTNELAWRDFLFERREHHTRLNPHTSLEHRQAHDRSTVQQWNALSEGQKSFYANRAKQIHLVSPAPEDHWGFYQHYYNRYFSQMRMMTDPHGTFASLQNFTTEILSEWFKLPLEVRKKYATFKSRVLLEQPIPPLPTPSTSTPWKRGSLLEGLHSPSLVSSQNQSSAKSVSRSYAADPPSNTDRDSASPLPKVKTENTDSQNMIPPGDNGEGRPSSHLNEIFDGCTPEQLENAVKKGLSLLADIQQSLQSEPSEDANHWLKSVENIQKQAVSVKTVVGVVGATGAGKSSVINAMLDEERLVPTNCMRACTAVVTEISYNHEDVPYRAEIEFITREDWAKQLKIMFQDLLDGSGQVSRECNNEDSEAGIAYAQIRAVYPKLTKELMASTSIDKLMTHQNVACLGTTQNFENADSLIFYKKLQAYVDSKEKSVGDKKDKKPKEMEHWPLIRVVRLYIKSPCLSTGAVIVDLPGVHDSNQARAAVAQSYLKQCTGLWIVAPITRAVDDKSAKNLLGDTFKRQLKMDGGYTTVTFICSKTDDISITEAQDSLGLEDEMRELYTKQEAAIKRKKKFEDQIKELRDVKTDMSATLEVADEELEVWEKLQDQCKDGKKVCAPKAKSDRKKRKRDGESKGSRKKARSSYAESDSDDDFVDDHDEDDSASEASSNASSEGDRQRTALTEDEIADKISELRATKKEGRREKSKVDDQIQDLKDQMKPLVDELDQIDAELSAKCIAGRNEYSRGAIQQDFAAGIKELDQELAEEEDAANFNPEIDTRDYDEVARSLPVFCVSARAYQKLKGRMKKDKNVPGFKNAEQTEIPKLQYHCKKLTEAGRETTCRRFLTNLIHLLNSLRLWSHNDGTARNLTEGQLKREARFLAEKIDKLDTAFERCVNDICANITEELDSSIFSTFPNAIASAKVQANNSVERWHAPVNRFDRANGGYYWATYKAIVRRDGVFTNGTGLHDFNEQLTTPIIQHIAGPWERVMSRKMPSILVGISAVIGDLLVKFHQEVETRAVRNGSSVAAFMMLKSQLPIYRETLKDAANAAKADITTKQRDINRAFVPIITNNMLTAYADCTAEVGSGQYMRMKGMMSRHVDQARLMMFDESTSHVQKLLKAMVKQSSEQLLAKTDEVLMSVKRDYTGVVVGADAANRSKLLPREERLMRRAILVLVDGAEHKFRQAVGLEEEDDDNDDNDGEDVGGERDESDEEIVEEQTGDGEGQITAGETRNADAEDQPELHSPVKTEPSGHDSSGKSDNTSHHSVTPKSDRHVKIDPDDLDDPGSEQPLPHTVHQTADDEDEAAYSSPAASIEYDYDDMIDQKPVKGSGGWRSFLGF